MTIVELCEPLFEYLCRLNVVQRLSQGSVPIERVQAEVQDLVRRTIGHRFMEAGKGDMFRDRMELLLICMADNLLANSDFPWAHAWDQNRLALRLYNKGAGDDFVKDQIEECINRAPPDRELSEVFYRVLVFGFHYPLLEEQDARQHVAQLGQIVGVPPVYGNPEAKPITPDAAVADTRRLTIRVGVALKWIVAVVACLLLLTFVTFLCLWRSSMRGLDTALDRITVGRASGQDARALGQGAGAPSKQPEGAGAPGVSPPAK